LIGFLFLLFHGSDELFTRPVCLLLLPYCFKCGTSTPSMTQKRVSGIATTLLKASNTVGRIAESNINT
jgi:hypothetical protein